MADQTITQTTTTIPSWAQPFFTGGSGITGIFPAAESLYAQPYQAYSGQRVAGTGNIGALDALQSQAINQAKNMGVSPYTTTAGGIAGAAALNAANYGYTPGTFQNQFVAPDQLSAANQGTVQSYMNPYQQAVTDIQKREATRASDIQQQANQAAATRAGAFGGSRQAIVEAERQRNLGQQLQDIQNTGDMNAYNQALAQINAEQAARTQTAGLGAQYGQAAAQLGEQSAQYGAGIGLQGLQTALQGAGQLGVLGQQQATQEMDINKLLAGYGAQGQALQQAAYDTAYQDWLNQKQYPYEQLGFYSDILSSGLRGASGVTQSAQNVYQSPPSTLSQLAGVGTALYGLNTLKAGGGRIKAPDNRDSKKSAGLADLALTKMA